MRRPCWPCLKILRMRTKKLSSMIRSKSTSKPWKGATRAVPRGSFIRCLEWWTFWHMETPLLFHDREYKHFLLTHDTGDDENLQYWHPPVPPMWTTKGVFVPMFMVPRPRKPYPGHQKPKGVRKSRPGRFGVLNFESKSQQRCWHIILDYFAFESWTCGQHPNSWQGVVWFGFLNSTIFFCGCHFFGEVNLVTAQLEWLLLLEFLKELLISPVPRGHGKPLQCELLPYQCYTFCFGFKRHTLLLSETNTAYMISCLTLATKNLLGHSSM